ncbi:MAG: 30S ribosomal protein S3, partial [Elusimicrobiota bacterium]
MGQKIHPRGLRLGYIQDWQSRWFSPKKMPELIGEDFEIRRMVAERFQLASVSWVDIERAGAYLKATIHTARPGVVIGRKGADIENLKKDIERLTKRKVYINVSEIKIPELDPRLVGQSVAQQKYSVIIYALSPPNGHFMFLDAAKQSGAKLAFLHGQDRFWGHRPAAYPDPNPEPSPEVHAACEMNVEGAV